ncbi:MAG: YjjG family noncanonical pyrimidine nucleotidase [Lachnospiraceae bacterium]|nr:YjjG family noncanonical pyrimidine nucleotidase [Lachnospiraceae bacterium]
MSQRFTTILWDVDNTLLDFDYSMRNSLKQCFQTVGITDSEAMIDRYAEINDIYWKRLERGEVTRAQLLVGRFQDLLTEFHLEHIDYLKFKEEFQENLGTIYSYLDDSLTICKSLQTKYKQYVVTNGVAKTQHSKLGLSGFKDVMKDLYISDEIGFNKPDKGFFEYCLAHIEEKDKDKILIVGDSLTSDIKGGNSVGIKTCWYNPKNKPLENGYQVDYVIRDLCEIYEVLGMFK